jgi:hypothetical protein
MLLEVWPPLHRLVYFGQAVAESDLQRVACQVASVALYHSADASLIQ